MLTRRAEPGSDQQRAELIAIQGGGMGLIVQPRPPDVGGRGVIQEFFFDGILVEPRDGGQPAGDGGAGASPGFQLAGEAFDVGAADPEQAQGAGTAPASELAQVQGVGLTGQAAVPARNPARASRSESVKAGWMGTRAAVVIGYLPDGLRPGILGQRRAPASERKPNVSRVSQSRHVTTRREMRNLGRRRHVRDRRIGMPINLIGICCPRCAEHLFSALGFCRSAMLRPACQRCRLQHLLAQMRDPLPAMAGYEMPLDSVFPRGTAGSVRRADWLAGPSAVRVSKDRAAMFRLWT